MLLPPELLTIIFLGGFRAANAQANDALITTTQSGASGASGLPSVDAAPISTPPPSFLGDSNDIVPTPADSTNEAEPTEDVYPCDLPEPPDWCNPPDFWHPEISATGWDDWGEWNDDGIGGGGGSGIAPSTTLPEPLQTPVVITTRTPTLIEIRTSIAMYSETLGEDKTTPSPAPGPPTGASERQELTTNPTAVQDAPQLKSTGTGGHSPGLPVHPTSRQPEPGQPVPVQQTAVTKQNTAWRQTSSSGNSLLDVIVGQLSKAQTGVQPAAPAVPTAVASRQHQNYEPQSAGGADTTRVGQDVPGQSATTIPGQVTPGAVSTIDSSGSIAVNDTITLGSTTLTLTPGLSTTVGTGTDATIIAIETDSLSQTRITISSSGTAVTATMTDAPATVTLLKTGFEASTTGDGGRAKATFHPSSTATTTSSKGVANDRRTSADGIVQVVLGLVGIALLS